MDTLDIKEVSRIIKNGLKEDLGSGDVTTDSIISPQERFSGYFIAKERGIIAGLAVAEQTFREVSDDIQFKCFFEDGSRVEVGDKIAEIEGPGRTILKAERLALNLLQRMSGIATLTRKFVDKTAGTNAVILDTRKTMPGLRILDKYAVKAGGGENHRFGLYDMVMIKDNHITAAGGISNAVSMVRSLHGSKYPIEVEVKNLTELEEALELKLDRIMLDNMSLDEMKKAVKITGGRTELEISGNVNPDTIEDYAKTGVDYISIGMLTHSVKALDISLLIQSD
jgi:nicotinate-nucleotide pyrophosphorylase (carboxylating)